MRSAAAAAPSALPLPVRSSNTIAGPVRARRWQPILEEVSRARAEARVEILLEALDEGGYAREDPVTAPGQVARRGGIIDVFPSDRAEPVRILRLEARPSSCACTLTEYCYIIRITAKLSNILFNPFKRFDLIKNTIVT